MIIKNIFKLSFVFALLFATTSCEKDEYYDDEGSYEVTNISSVKTADSNFFFDLPETQSVTINVTQSTEGVPGNITVVKRINDGEWVNHTTLNSLPAELKISLNEALDGTGFGLTDISTSDVIEIGYLIDGEFLNGLTTIPIICSTDLVLSGFSSDILDGNDGDAAEITFTVTPEGPVDLESVDVFVNYNDGGAILLRNITDLPSTQTFTIMQLTMALGINFADVSPGDGFVLTYGLNSNGRTCPSTVLTSVPFQCNSDLGGMYDVTAVGTSTDACCPDETTVSTVVTLTDNGGGAYTISDWSGGLYFEWYDIYGIEATSNVGDIKDVCAVITLVTETEPFGETLEGSGSVDTGTGVITLSWLNGYGDRGTLTMTPQ